MSGRCKACNAVLTEDEMVAKWEDSDDYCDLCSYCLNQSDPNVEWDSNPYNDYEEEDE